MHKAIRALVILPCAALVLSTFALQAAPLKSEKFSIPFEFRVQNQILPAGEYQIQQTDGSGFALLVNTKTGERIEFVRPLGTHREGKARLVFEDREGRQALKRIL
jgi:hypothetical protein